MTAFFVLICNLQKKLSYFPNFSASFVICKYGYCKTTKNMKLHFHIEGGHRIDANMAKEIIENILPLHEEATSLYVKQLKEMDNAPWL